MVFISFCYISRCYPSDKCHKSVFLSRLRVMNTNWPPLCGSSTGWAWQSWSPRWAWSCWTSGESLYHLLSSRKLKQTLNMFTGRLSRMRCWSCFPPLFPGSSWIPRNPWTPRHQGTQSEFVDLIKKICTFSCCDVVTSGDSPDDADWFCAQGFSGLDGAKGDSGPAGPKVE